MSKRYHTGIHNSPKCKQECKYRSSWELKYMQYLDKCDDVIEYEYETIRVGYLRHLRANKISFYIPDFLIHYKDNTKKMVEIKPHKKLDQKLVVRKAEAAKQWCQEHNASYVILTEDELKELNVL